MNVYRHSTRRESKVCAVVDQSVLHWRKSCHYSSMAGQVRYLDKLSPQGDTSGWPAEGVGAKGTALSSTTSQKANGPGPSQGANRHVTRTTAGSGGLRTRLFQGCRGTCCRMNSTVASGTSRCHLPSVGSDVLHAATQRSSPNTNPIQRKTKLGRAEYSSRDWESYRHRILFLFGNFPFSQYSKCSSSRRQDHGQ